MLEIVIPKSTQKINQSIMEAPVRFRKGIRAGANNSGRSIQKRVTTMLGTGTRSGVHYRKLPHRSSAEGEYPRSQSGRLARSVYYHANKEEEFRVGATEKHAKWLSDGTVKMRARPHPKLPWMQLAMEIEERNIENYLQLGPEEALKC